MTFIVCNCDDYAGEIARSHCNILDCRVIDSEPNDRKFLDCSFETLAKAKSYESGVYLVNPVNASSTFHVYCDIDQEDGGWTVFQRRTGDEVSFKKTWDEYANGFGDVSGDHWLGNEKIHLLTNQYEYMLRIEVTDMFDDVYFAEYEHFRISGRADGYRLDVGDHMGNLSDALVDHKGMRFSAPDKDLDASSTHCAKYYESGWWFSQCQKANLNGDFRIGIIWFDIVSEDWIQLKRTVMKMRPMKRCANC
ncbi:unnamed protein product [Soboliphyme baturini]|uniref:Fibrinogen C-terminal domain-containing protein n=1 Tax=Soboliphyme baturini TaxID=241478 RepID=A0A3P8AX80_9BILA|nr:unnamed protein product [Soboliphyme baturini]